MIFFAITYLISAEFVQAKKSKGEVLVFQRGHVPAAVARAGFEISRFSERPDTFSSKTSTCPLLPFAKPFNFQPC